MAGKLIIICAMTGQGKTTFVKNALARVTNKLVFDINNEYQDLPLDNELTASRYIEGDYREFVDIAANKRNTAVVFEDATGFFSGRVGQETSRMIVQKRHSGNDYYFLFHSIQRIPKAIYELANFVILFKTNDEFDTVKKRFAKLYPPFCNLQNSRQYSKEIIKLIEQ